VWRLLDWPPLNFALTNLIPRRQVTRLTGWFSRIEQPWIKSFSIRVWCFLADVSLRDARKQEFSSLHDCFVRELRDGARPLDVRPDIMVSPCDAIVGASGTVCDGLVLQAKSRRYPLAELLRDAALARYYDGGSYVTLRLTAGMYHRFHAPYDCTVRRLSFVPGDTWNVNPPALSRVDKLYCRNERAVVRCVLPSSDCLTLVPVAAILVASLRLHCIDEVLGLRYQGPLELACNHRYRKGQELGWFEQGSTIIVFAPAAYQLVEGLQPGGVLRMGEALLGRQRGARASSVIGDSL
jgi:phosphatidylserine decarboxylase